MPFFTWKLVWPVNYSDLSGYFGRMEASDNKRELERRFLLYNAATIRTVKK